MFLCPLYFRYPLQWVCSEHDSNDPCSGDTRCRKCRYGVYGLCSSYRLGTPSRSSSLPQLCEHILHRRTELRRIYRRVLGRGYWMALVRITHYTGMRSLLTDQQGFPLSGSTTHTVDHPCMVEARRPKGGLRCASAELNGKVEAHRLSRRILHESYHTTRTTRC